MLVGIYTLYHLIISSAGWLALGSSAFITVILVGTAVMQPEGYPDPFLPYTDVGQGASATALSRFICQRPNSMEMVRSEQQCLIQPDNFFNRIIVTEKSSKIVSVSFTSDSLQVVDVVRHWGEPTQVLRNEGRGNYFLKWIQGVTAITVASTRRFSYQLPVQFVILTNSD